MIAAGTVINNKYRVTGLIGQGGTSYVYSAEDCLTGNKLAIKEAIRNVVQDNQIFEQGLATEGRLLMSLTSPHLPKIYDVIEESNHIMIVMDFVEGQSLDKVLEQNGHISVESVVNWGIQICDVFEYLHTQNPPVIYRDMKPSNVILQPNGNIMMIDFGTARTQKIGSNMDSDTILIGTQGFAAPEQFGGWGQSDARTDIFCLGATFFNLITNHSPYLKPYGITPLGDWIPELKNCDMDKVIQKCTEKDPYERFQSAAELRAALEWIQSNSGKTSFFNKLLGNSKKTSTGWQAPIMQLEPLIKEEPAVEPIKEAAPVANDDATGILSNSVLGNAAASGWNTNMNQQGEIKPAEKKEQTREFTDDGSTSKFKANGLTSKFKANGRTAKFRANTAPDIIERNVRPLEKENTDPLPEIINPEEPVTEPGPWKTIMLITLVGGLIVFLVGLIITLVVNTAGIILLVLGILILLFGVYAVMRYLRE